MDKYLIISLLSFIFVSASSQVYTPLDSLKLALDQKYSAILYADIEQFKESRKYNFLNFLPSLGYDFYSHRPIITYNIAALAGLIRSNNERLNKVTSISKHSEITVSSQKNKLVSKYNRLSNLFASYDLELSIYDKFLQLYQIEKAKYNNQEITIAEFTKHQIDLQNKQKVLFAFKDRIYNVIIDIEYMTDYQLNYEIKSFCTDL